MSASWSIAPGGRQSLGFADGGTVTQVLVNVGDRVQPGQVLARIDADGAFTARVPVGERDRHPCRFDGRWLVRDGLLLAAVAVPAREDPAVPASDASA